MLSTLSWPASSHRLQLHLDPLLPHPRLLAQPRGLHLDSALSALPSPPPSPARLRMAAHPVLDAYSVAARTWHSHKELGWIGGEVTTKNIDGDNVVLEFKDESDKVRVLLTSHAFFSVCTSCTRPNERVAVYSDVVQQRELL